MAVHRRCGSVGSSVTGRVIPDRTGASAGTRVSTGTTPVAAVRRIAWIRGG